MSFMNAYGELNVALKFKGKNNKICFYLPCSTTIKGLSKYFLKFTRKDPDCFDFYSNKIQITGEQNVYYTNDNPLKDFVIECKAKKNISIKDVLITFKKNETENEQKFSTSKTDKKDIAKLLGNYLSLDPSLLNIKKEGDLKFRVTSEHLIISKAEMKPDKEIILVYSDNSTGMDLKYLASVYDINNCSILTVNNKFVKNNKVVSNCFVDGPNILSFSPYMNEFYYKENEDSDPKKATIIGAPIGRNYMRAIAKDTNQSLDVVSHKVLMVEDANKNHVYKVKCSKFVRGAAQNYFILTNESPYKFEIKRESGKSIQEICFDPQLCIFQVRQYLSNYLNIPSSYFIKIKNSKDQKIDDKTKIEDAFAKGKKLIVEVDEPKPVKAIFLLYNNNEKKVELTIDPDESIYSVRKSVAEQFQINPNYINIFKNSHRIFDQQKFIKHYSDDCIYDISSELFVNVKYNSTNLNFIFPLEVDFKLLTDICRARLNLEGKDIGFIDKSKLRIHDNMLVYSTWEKEHIFPGPQFIARYRKYNGNNKVKLSIVTKKSYEKDLKKLYKAIDPNQQFELDILIYTAEGRLESKVTSKGSQKIADIAKNSLNKDQQDQIIKSDQQFAIFFVFDREIKFNSTVSDVQQIFETYYKNDESKVRPKLIALAPPQIYRYKLPSKDSNTENSMTVNLFTNLFDLKKKSTKDPQMLIVKYNNMPIYRLSQPIMLFNPRLPFEIEYIKEISYKITYKDDKGKVFEKELKLDEKATVYDIVKESIDLLASTGNKEFDKLKATQVRVTINSIILTKDIDHKSVIKEFGPKGTAEVIPLRKIGFTVQGENLYFPYFASSDTILYMKKSLLKRLEAKEEYTDYYFLLYNGIAAEDTEHLSDYLDDDDLCFDVVPIQFTAKICAILPDFTHTYVISKDLLMYDVKEFFAQYYEDIEDVDSIELIDKTTNLPIDDNDNPIDGQFVELKFNVDNLQLKEKFKQKVARYKEETNRIIENASIPEDSFSCPFTYESDNFYLTIEKSLKCITAKTRITNYLRKSLKDSSNDESIDFDDIMITINNKEVLAREVLFERYNSACESNPEVRFIVKREEFDLTQSSIFMSTSKSIFFQSFEANDL